MKEKVGLEIKKTIKARRTEVFRAWLEPELLKKWFAPGKMRVTLAKTDPKVGGAWRIEMAGDNPKGIFMTPVFEGVYRTIRPDEELSFTWSMLGNPASKSTVTVTFRDVDEGTEVILLHEGFGDVGTRDGHHHGWSGSLENLAGLFQKQPGL